MAKVFRLVIFVVFALCSAVAQQYGGPQAVVFTDVGKTPCNQGQCQEASAAFKAAIDQVLVGSGYFVLSTTPEATPLQLTGNVLSVATGDQSCILFICTQSELVNAAVQLADASTGAQVANLPCQGSSSGGTISLPYFHQTSTTDVGKAAADCAARIVQALTLTATLRPYLTLPPGSPIANYHPTNPPTMGVPQPGPTTPPVAQAPAPVAALTYAWAYTLFFLDEATRKQACKEGYESAAAGSTATAPGHAELTSPEGTVLIDTSYKTTFIACQNVGLKAQAMPDSVPQEDFVLSINALTTNQTPALALVFVNNAGNEIGRVSVYSKENSWDYCSYGTGPCKVTFTPSTINNTTRSLISQASQIKLLINFGKGIETLTMSKDRFPDLK